MKKYFILILFLGSIFTLKARVLTVGDSGDGYRYSTISQAAIEAIPGDTIMVFKSNYSGGEYISNLKGTQSDWINIIANPSDSVIFQGGNQAWHLQDVAFLYISGFIYEGQTVNGVNIDDGGTFDTPSHNIIIENCHWRSMNATGNNDELKLSGIDTFYIKNCTFENGSVGGSLVDMVGCHYGSFINNRFINGGSNSIQAKGGSSQIKILRNTFINGGLRAINIGGSTGAAYFRPQTANYEASHITVQANIFFGSQAPIAYVGAVNCAVANNTIVEPEKWAIRILQENIDGMQACGNNIFINNIVYIGNNSANPTVNIGPNTLASTFRFFNNLWYNYENGAWAGPNLPSSEENGLIGQNPLFKDLQNRDVSLSKNSPAIGKGNYDPLIFDTIVRDYLGNKFNDPPSIGAIEGEPPIVSVSEKMFSNGNSIELFPNPIFDHAKIRFYLKNSDLVSIKIFDELSREVCVIGQGYYCEGMHELVINSDYFLHNASFFYLIFRAGGYIKAIPILINK